MPLYFAYGSNMSPRQMKQRCPSARARGIATLQGWRFIITTRGTANIVSAPSRFVHGVLWDLNCRDLAHLDRWEGTHWRNYLRRRVLVREPSGPERLAFVYISIRHYLGVPRAEYLRSAVLVGARAFSLPADTITELNSWLPDRSIGSARTYLGHCR